MDEFSHYSSLFEKALHDAPHKVILFADMVGSTDLKLRSAEVGWLPTVGRFLDLVSEAVRYHDGVVIKYLGDGALAVFGDEQAASAINAAIKIQESLEADNDSNRLRNCQCRIGIATGRVVEYQGPGGVVDYVGTVVDLAARLSSSASAGAIWADLDTIDAANLNRIKSRVGDVLRRSSRDYVSEAQKVELKGFQQPVIYKEVIWAQASKGVSNEVATRLVDRAAALQRASEVPQREQPLVGTVTVWKEDLGHGFIRTAENGDFYIDRRFVVDRVDLVPNRSVAFLERPPMIPGKQPVAACVVQEGQRVVGPIVTLKDRYGFIGMRDSNNNQMNLFVYFGDQISEYNHGQTIAAMVVPGQRGGLAGKPLESLDDADDADELAEAA